MSGPLRVRLLTPADLPFADSLRALAGWNQTLADWRRFLQFSPQGCFLAEWDHVPAGVVTTITYGPKLAWIGMALVHPEYRRRGIGHALLEHAIEHLRGNQVSAIKLDATPAGRSTYLRLGFRDECSLTRWEGAPAISVSFRPSRWEIAGITELDATAFGRSREQLLHSLAQESLSKMIQRNDGYGMLRRGTLASYLGPIVARSPELGLKIAKALVGRSAGAKIFWDIFDSATEVACWAEQQGFSRQRTLTRMRLGEALSPGFTSMQIAIAGPELG